MTASATRSSQVERGLALLNIARASASCANIWGMTSLVDTPDLASSGSQEAGESPGARWWQVDVHAHSPASRDYGGAEGHDTEGDKPSFREWVKAYVEAGVDGAVISDHNTHEGIEPARRALAELQSEDPSFPKLVLFPGVELTVAGGVHVLGIFDPETPAEIISDVIARCNYLGTRGASTQTANATVSDAARHIQQAGGICVPAHSDKNAGIFTRSELDLPTIKQSGIAAVEVVDDDNVPKAKANGWVALLGSDAHHLTPDGCPPGQDAKFPGSHFTWIKAERVDLKGLSLALTDAKESVTRGRRGNADPNEVLHGYIDRVLITHKGTTRTFRLNPWMNCLIGGRGVGKSTILELIRLAMGRSGDLLDTALNSELQRFIPGGERAQQWWSASSAIEVRYVKDGRPLRIVWSGADPEEPRVEAKTESGWESQAGFASDRAPIQVFSQKQIYELARQPQSFLSIVDRMEEIRKAEWTEEYLAIESQFRKAREHLRELLTETDRADRLKGRLEEVQGRLRHLAELRADPRYLELEANESQVRRATSTEEEAQGLAERLKEQATALRSLASTQGDLPGYGARIDSFTAAAGLIDQAVAQLDGSALEWQQGSAQPQWVARIEELSDWLTSQTDQPHRLSADQVTAYRKQEKDLQAELLEFENIAARLSTQEHVLCDLLSQLASKRKELHQRRFDYVAGLTAGAERTRVRVFHQGAIANVGEELRRILNRPDSFDSAFEDQGIPKPLFDDQPKSPTFPTSSIPAFKASLIDLVNRGAESDIAKRVRIDARFHRRSGDNQTFDLETSILLWFPEDLVTVEYKPEGSNNFTPVDQGSPGQKTAALLAVILQMGDEPLLLDQPEDDLENKLIKHLAVETLKRIKRNRQLVISTHNANIVVTSGAEHVLVIQHGEHLPAIEASGTLQTEAVRSSVCLILEGGEEAIRTRFSRLVG